MEKVCVSDKLSDVTKQICKRASIIRDFIFEEDGMGTVEVILIIVEKNQRQRTLYL